MKKFIILFFLFTLPIASLAEETQESQKDAAPEADSVWGAMRYTGYHIQKGSVTAGSEIKKGSIKAGKTMEKGFKKAGGEIKGFFVGDDD
jgi:hypothetical protein